MMVLSVLSMGFLDGVMVKPEESSHGSQFCDKSLNLTPGKVLAPAAMNWKTEKSKRLNEHAKSMMSHFKISSNPGTPETSAASSSVGARGSMNQSDLWKKYLTRYVSHKSVI